MILRSTIERAERFRDMHLAGVTIEQIAKENRYSTDYVRKLISAVSPSQIAKDPLYWQRAIAVAKEAVGVTDEKFLGDVRKPKKLVYARWAVMLCLRKRGCSWKQVAKRVKRDHTTVIYGVDQAQYMAAHNPEVAALVALVDAA